MLCIQEEVRTSNLGLRKVGGKQNPADLGTKGSHTVAGFLRLRELCGLTPQPAWALALGPATNGS